MKNVWILTLMVVLFSVLCGCVLVPTPQIALLLGVSSATLGWIGACTPLGYVISCLAFGQLFARFPGKYVVLGGIATSVLAVALMSAARRGQTLNLGLTTLDASTICVVAQLAFGFTTGAFWPFASAWMLDFQSPAVPKTRILRHYNTAWTSGTAAGMLGAGVLCNAGFIYETLYAAVGAGGLCLLGALLVPATRHSLESNHAAEKRPAPAPLHAGHKIGLPLLLAAVLANAVALGTRVTIANNFAELNRFLDGGAYRMGLFNGLMIMGEFCAFSLGQWYERYLGMRRTYFTGALLILAANLAFAFSNNTAVLIAAVILNGFALALAFQAGIVAATSYFKTPRTGTTCHEAVVGLCSMMSIGSGQLIAALKASGTGTETALRAPFFMLAALAIIVFPIQAFLISRRANQRALLGANREFPAAVRREEPVAAGVR